MFRVKNPYFIKKSHIRRFNSAVKSIASLENVVSFELLLIILMKGSL